MKQKFIEWFTKNNNGCSPAMEDDISFVYEMTQHMFEAYQAGVAEGEAKCAALAAENAWLKAGILQASEDMEAHHDDYALFSYDADGEQMDALLRLCDAQDSIASLENVKTPATDAFLAEVRAQGVEMFALMFAEEAIKTNNITTGWRARASRAASEYAEALREDAALLRKGVQS
ncbi:MULTISPECIES: hypothetical protein [Enterobacter cloacae complex]|uniref:Phage protein n=1 Tax=Enterobacter hormaechei TaxID=158836 RepID=A0A855VPN9_9ENTR|nr:hypothetical protein [Enterobacter hormaechei]KDM55307.1 hypothetical protein AF34_00820 [Enterobacter hormaechei subsp. hoffmannii]MBJ6473282.1 hypothetical protein [Enterobacter hormaechei]MBJ6515364.1 hypothetical protein [Enterobacter hormaechei]MBJ6533195.1 hypothetical protein [Enterobacter hormaechei]MBK4334695.1 hypothetical protein [Enterobacter hormaechei]